MTTANRRQVWLAGAGLGLGALGRLLAGVEAVVEWHRRTLFPALSSLLQGMSGSSMAALGEAAAFVLVVAAVSALLAVRTRALGGFVLSLGILVFAFYASWGFAYRYPPLSARLAQLSDEPQGEESTALLIDLAERSAQLTARVSEGAISFSGSNTEFLSRVNAGLNAGLARWPASIEAAPVHALAFGPVKPSSVSFAMSRLQLSGYYFPWTGEALINAEMPRTLWPRVGGHEKAHQRGFARENEATVIGLITCLSSPDPTVLYGGALGLFTGLDRELSRVDPLARRRIWAALPPRVSNDLRAEAAFWKRHEGVAGAVSEKVNDAYLKTQGVRSGVDSYAETTRLILQAAATKTLDLGRLLLEPLPSTPAAPIR